SWKSFILSSLSSTIITVFDIAELPRCDVCRQPRRQRRTYTRATRFSPSHLTAEGIGVRRHVCFRAQRLTSAIAPTSAETLRKRKRCRQAYVTRAAQPARRPWCDG